MLHERLTPVGTPSELAAALKDDAFVDAVKKKWGGLDAGGRAVKRGEARIRAMLQNYEVTEAIREGCSIAAGFTMGDALRTLVKWINGDIDHDGGKLPPKYEALAKYFDLTVRKPTKNVDVTQRSLVARVDVRDAAPPIRARVLDVLPAGDDK